MFKYKMLMASLLTTAALVLSAGVTTAHADACGNGNVQDQACDDNNTTPGDGCSATCTVETGWECTGEPSVCALIVCGNGITQTGEQCDGGGCCSPTCQLLAAATVCRAAGGVCDVAESCDGSASTCPTDAKLSTECRASAGACDLAETCSGGNDCPADAKSIALCRGSAGICDPVAESCDGVSNTCPADTFAAGGTPCRPSDGVCDVAEACTGSTASCPADVFVSSATTCNASQGICDPAETCTGSTAGCPVDAKSSSQCRAAAGPCDLAESCDGTDNNCPSDSKSTAVCRASAGVCDPVAESCDGTGNSCPADALSAGGTECRISGGVCDPAEACTGSTATCPGDAKSSSATSCREAGGVCDLGENCTGSTNDCPADVKKASDVVCRASVSEVCDVAENCTGVSNNCPDDELVNCGDNDGIACTEATCDASEGCIVVDSCVEICRGAGFWQTHGGTEKEGTNVTEEVIEAAGSLEVCGQTITNSDDLGSLQSALEGLCVRTQGVEERPLYRQLVTTALNCAISEGGTCDEILSRFIDVSFSDCNALCEGNPVEEGPTAEECKDQLECFNSGGRIIDGQCARGNCETDSEILCGEDYGDCPLIDEVAQDCVRFEDSCARSQVCADDLDVLAAVCPKKSRASSPKTCRDARKNFCTIDGCF